MNLSQSPEEHDSSVTPSRIRPVPSHPLKQQALQALLLPPKAQAGFRLMAPPARVKAVKPGEVGAAKTSSWPSVGACLGVSHSSGSAAERSRFLLVLGGFGDPVLAAEI